MHINVRNLSTARTDTVYMYNIILQKQLDNITQNHIQQMSMAVAEEETKDFSKVILKKNFIRKSIITSLPYRKGKNR